MKSKSRIAGAFDRTCSHNHSVLSLSLSQPRKTPTPHRYIEPRLDTHPHSYTIALATLLIIYLQGCKKKSSLLHHHLIDNLEQVSASHPKRQLGKGKTAPHDANLDNVALTSHARPIRRRPPSHRNEPGNCIEIVYRRRATWSFQSPDFPSSSNHLSHFWRLFNKVPSGKRSKKRSYTSLGTCEGGCGDPFRAIGRANHTPNS
ncbi:hypothetical protein HD553DRAFT_121458 [Filobasidium floriforme]|uniref:uncharacterized protein n=1 Tax=Filobasidium floriforme TaxID=5210 RepID=UPI001E8EB456|nr:uncharacterized protein HD553DRAFT_121458 [Filobasidium floriforme]KAH8080170.1 hypothetical protein HD553DRAFT_121458 [Filobasidium floriforme]